MAGLRRLGDDDLRGDPCKCASDGPAGDPLAEPLERLTAAEGASPTLTAPAAQRVAFVTTLGASGGGPIPGHFPSLLDRW
jgi:hypothetical protein